MARYTALNPGEPAPFFRAPTQANPMFTFDTTAGRWLVLAFFDSLSNRPATAKALKMLEQQTGLFDDVKTCFFGVTHDAADIPNLRDRTPGMRYFHDTSREVGKLYGTVSHDDATAPHRGRWFIIDPTMRIEAVIPMSDDLREIPQIISHIHRLPPPNLYAGFEVQAPVLILPRVFEPELCDHLIGLYEAQGGEESGFMRQVDGKTVAVHDRSHKVRKDINLTDPDLLAKLQARVRRRVIPEIAKVHQFHVTRMERYIVSCYAAEDQGHFNAHRDNTTSGTAHRRFAVSINLNHEFEGGEVSFPEYGPRSFKAPPGGAVVFSCSLLHKVSTVTKGRRYAFLPFLYDDAAAKIREANNAQLAEGVGQYKTAG